MLSLYQLAAGVAPIEDNCRDQGCSFYRYVLSVGREEVVADSVETGRTSYLAQDL